MSGSVAVISRLVEYLQAKAVNEKNIMKPQDTDGTFAKFKIQLNGGYGMTAPLTDHDVHTIAKGLKFMLKSVTRDANAAPLYRVHLFATDVLDQPRRSVMRAKVRASPATLSLVYARKRAEGLDPPSCGDFQ